MIGQRFASGDFATLGQPGAEIIEFLPCCRFRHLQAHGMPPRYQLIRFMGEADHPVVTDHTFTAVFCLERQDKSASLFHARLFFHGCLHYVVEHLLRQFAATS